ncbi:hypothetical protein CEP54_007725 [Fusarium duplospermum]|uniref:Uncharacterized protein n=1 Tax=Fusarium duplospermum TaxID=1325734 RepID=A0A428PZM4_9HYPO|nr:hypothetical protein CEP54_007725 [Fusarium duplospermum]
MTPTGLASFVRSRLLKCKFNETGGMASLICCPYPAFRLICGSWGDMLGVRSFPTVGSSYGLDLRGHEAPCESEQGISDMETDLVREDEVKRTADRSLKSARYHTSRYPPPLIA